MALIYEPKQAVILRLRQPSKVTSVIRTAKVFKTPKGDTLVGVPHRPDEARALRDLGIHVPEPMNMYYKYPGRFAPFGVQRTTASFASMCPRCFILNSMGLGKTITTLWAIDYLRSIGAVHRVLVVCPISVMERTWANEVFGAFPTYKCNVLYGTAQKRKKLLADEADIYIINTDGQSIIEKELADRPDIDLIVIDELALFRNSGAKRWKAMNSICNKQCGGKRRVWGLTGSPTPNSPEDAYGLAKLVTPANPELPKTFGRWRDRVMTQMTQFRWVPKDGAPTMVSKLLQPAVRFCLDDAVDLPPQTVMERKIAMTDEQKAAFRSMANQLYLEVQEGNVTAANEAVKASKLLQVACGAVYGEDHSVLNLNNGPRLEALDEVVCESEGKVIVFAPFSSAIDQITEFLRSRGHTVGVITGDTSKTDRDSIFYSFQNEQDPTVIVAQPSTMSHGLTLTAATTIVWYGPTYSNEVYQQACARVRRPGQKRTTVICHFVSSSFEDKVYKRLSEKQSLQGALLDMVRNREIEVY